ncbi:MAG: TatD family hydrolase, partial [Clostridiales bacterium]|nr:TatD family hydrolase [Clostridiales bacterium]
KEILSLGMYLGFTGVVTFNNAKKVLEAVKATPADRLLLETDCPYMAPVPHRGKTCTSDMIAFTAEKIAQLKEMDTQALIDQAHQNTLSCFGINK